MQSIPTWFSRALAVEADVKTLVVEDTEISYRVWGDEGLPPVVLIHGGAAHASWWDHIGPHLTDEHRVIAIDLSGHGDSGRREEYSLELWAHEVMSVAAAESDEKPVLLGHSMGGFVTLTAAREYGLMLRGAAVIDSPVEAPSPESVEWRKRKAERPFLKFYASKDQITARFRTLPEDSSNIDFVMRHVADRSVKETEQGWTWKFDPLVFLHSQLSPDHLAEAECEIALINGERGMPTEQTTQVVQSRLGGNVPVTTILDAGHHIMLDQPTALVAVLQTLLGQWRTR